MNSKVYKYRGMLIADNPAYWLEGRGWHGLVIQLEEGMHCLWAEHNPKWARLAHESKKWNYDDLAGEWVLCGQSPEEQETMYGPRAGADNPETAQKMVLTLLASMYEDLKDAKIQATPWIESEGTDIRELFTELRA